jgi:hypothetical protein
MMLINLYPKIRDQRESAERFREKVRSGYVPSARTRIVDPPISDRKEYARAYYAKTKERRLAYLAQPHIRARYTRRMRTYSYRLSQYELRQMFDAQGGVCKLCGGVNTDGKALHVDHDHACCSGKTSCGKCVRALLCNSCNMGLGKFGDDPSLLRRAADYIEAAREVRK